MVIVVALMFEAKVNVVLVVLEEIFMSPKF